MTKAMVGTLPWMVVLALAGAAIWWLLSREMIAGRWLLAGLLLGHGLVHALFLAPGPAATVDGPAWPFDMARSWLVTGAGLDIGLVRAIGVALIAVVAVGFATAALATVGILVPAGWWPAAVAGSAIASVAMLVLFFEPQLVLGVGIDGVLVWAAVARAWVPGAAT